jgi:hypothetical protein
MPDSASSQSAVRISAVVAIAVAAGVAAWLLTSGGGGRTATGSLGANGPVAGKGTTVPVTAQGLETLAGALKQPIYWAGVKPGYKLELTREGDGRAFIRYLPPSATIGSPHPYLTIGTYLLDNAYSLTRKAAARPDSVSVAVPGAVAFYSRKSPTNIYLAYPGSNAQVEVFDPWAPGARKLVGEGSVVTVSAAGRTTPAAGFATAPQGLTLAGVRSFAKRVGHPVYWIGPRPDTTYEVTQTTDGRIYVRYLPRRAPVGTTKPFLTIGTYPVRNALQATQARASAAGSVRVPAGSGGVAFYARGRPTNVYEAFPGVDYQLEIYDPSGGAAGLVSAGRIVTV